MENTMDIYNFVKPVEGFSFDYGYHYRLETIGSKRFTHVGRCRTARLNSYFIAVSTFGYDTNGNEYCATAYPSWYVEILDVEKTADLAEVFFDKDSIGARTYNCGADVMRMPQIGDIAWCDVEGTGQRIAVKFISEIS